MCKSSHKFRNTSTEAYIMATTCWNVNVIWVYIYIIMLHNVIYVSKPSERYSDGALSSYIVFVLAIFDHLSIYLVYWYSMFRIAGPITLFKNF